LKQARSLLVASTKEERIRMSAGERKVESEDHTGYNWRNVLTNFAAMSGIFAGFCITFIVLILGTPAPGNGSFTELAAACGQLAVLALGISAALFISAAEFFLRAKEFDKYDIPAGYRAIQAFQYSPTDEAWRKFEEESDDKCREYNAKGTSLYNAAVIMIWIGVLFAIFPYNLWVAFVVAGLGIILEIWQTYGRK